MSASSAAAATRSNSMILPSILPSTSATSSTLSQLQQKQQSRSPSFSGPSSESVSGTAGAAMMASTTSSSASVAAAVAEPAQKRFAGIQFSWVHFLAGGTGGMVGALVTSPLDVVKTRLQSSLYHSSQSSTVVPRTGISAVAGHIKDTCLFLGHIYRHEGPRALYKGLGPNLVGVIPARAINFATYGNGKKFYTDLNNGKETAIVHLSSAATAGVVTATMTNPIWLVKTRMQLQVEGVRQYKNSLDCVYQILKTEGIRGMYRGLSASYLGVAEGTIQWVIYEKLKTSLKERRRLNGSSASQGYMIGGKDIEEWVEFLGAAGAAKFIASAITYPHEVLRTRLRQVPVGNEAPKYTGLKQTFQLVLKEEGVAALYGGLTAHMMRVVPNAAIMFFCYEAILHRFG
ncbi:solute carrier family 25, member 33/36 [Entomortierella parvispora]|uniref:Solute carrier family 25, member 33/36 n=1 Tax=Entomortierella parvispora TaxID=205924 RepID=A0A9P3HH66_9FUNG|nr:solute carrier family 25, member 33/36 [Entomortierella parvispora]